LIAVHIALGPQHGFALGDKGYIRTGPADIDTDDVVIAHAAPNGAGSYDTCRGPGEKQPNRAPAGARRACCPAPRLHDLKRGRNAFTVQLLLHLTKVAVQ